MLFDAAEWREEWFATVFDVCICGAGPAGITLARKLAAKGWSVALCESGGLEPSAEAQDLTVGENIGVDYLPLDAVRLRGLGGASGHWEGETRNLETYDFYPLPFHPLSGWPISRADLDPYADETADILDLPPWETAPDLFAGMTGALQPTTFRYSAPTHFGEKYRAELEASPNIRLFVNCTLLDIELNPELNGVDHLIFRTFARPERFTIRARLAVLGLGGIENARFLLNANRQMPNGLANDNDLVGRYYMEHPRFRAGWAIMREHPGELYSYAPTHDMMLAEQCLDFVVSIIPIGEGRSGLKQMVIDGLCWSDFVRRLAEGVTGRALDCYDAEIYVASEQALNPESRVRLGDELDAFGQRRVALDWQLADLDFHTQRAAVMELGRVMAENDLGRVQVLDWLLADDPVPPGTDVNQVASFHHLGTTRMADDPKSGVVDRDGRVHGIDNLYIAGSSVFPSGGYANPTYTIVQLALRLADHIDERLRTGS